MTLKRILRTIRNRCDLAIDLTLDGGDGAYCGTQFIGADEVMGLNAADRAKVAAALEAAGRRFDLETRDAPRPTWDDDY